MYIREYLRTEATTISSNAFVSDAERITYDCSIRYLPVVDYGRLLGLVAQKDLIGKATAIYFRLYGSV
ncbi:CBS domain-containing protein [Chloroflexota bacterium]